MIKTAFFTVLFLVSAFALVLFVEVNTYPESWEADFSTSSRDELYDQLERPDVVTEGAMEWYRPSKTKIAGKEIIRVSLIVFFEDYGGVSRSEIALSFPILCLAEWVFLDACDGAV